MRIIILSLLLIVSTGIFACDACASFSNGVNLGVMPLLRNNMISSRYTYSNFKTIPFAYSEATNKEITQSLDLQARFKLHNIFQISAALPFNNFNQKGDFNEVNLIGLGDMTVMGSFLLLNKTNFEKDETAHLFLINFGAKLPTGKTNVLDGTGKLFNPRMQPGSGSLDYVLGTNYIMKFKKNSIQFDLNAKINTMNESLYQLGNQYRGTIRYSRWMNVGMGNLLLSAAYVYDHILDDYSENDIFHGMHGRKEHHAQFGVDYFFNKSVVSISYQNPIYKSEKVNAINLLNTFTVGFGYSI